MKGLTWCMALLLSSAPAWSWAKVETRSIQYKDGSTLLRGTLAWDDSFPGKRPGIVLFHEWWGHNAYADRRAAEVAKLGYVVFAADMYGKGVLLTDPKKAAAMAGRFDKDRALMVRRALAGLAVLKRQPDVDTSRLAAMGYCFGGGVALQLARAGVDLKGVVSFHGDLSDPDPQDDHIKAKVLAMQGADDPYFGPKAVDAFEDEMRKAGADWQMVVYSHAVHGFTNPANGDDPSRGVAYNAEADRRSWQAMKDFFAEIFAGPSTRKAL